MPRHDVGQLEEILKTLASELRDLGDGEDLIELINVLRQPGWTTPAEFTLTRAVAEAMLAQTRQLAALKESLMIGSREVLETAERCN
jgi:hypothetical protein